MNQDISHAISRSTGEPVTLRLVSGEALSGSAHTGPDTDAVTLTDGDGTRWTIPLRHIIAVGQPAA